MSRQIPVLLNFLEMMLRKQWLHGSGLVVAVFENEPAVCLQVRVAGGEDNANGVEAIDSGDQRTGRFEADIALLQVRITCSDVRRIADNDVGAKIAR